MSDRLIYYAQPREELQAPEKETELPTFKKPSVLTNDESDDDMSGLRQAILGTAISFEY